MATKWYKKPDLRTRNYQKSVKPVLELIQIMNFNFAFAVIVAIVAAMSGSTSAQDDPAPPPPPGDA